MVTNGLRINQIVFWCLSAATSILLLQGCATPGKNKLVNSEAELPSIQQEYSKQLSKLAIGASLEEFLQLFPKAYVGGQNGKVTAYELISTQSYVTKEDISRQNLIWGFGTPSARSSTQVLWFYFYNNKLAKWGRPQDWQGTSSEQYVKEQEEGKGISSGTGFAISKDGLIVTAYHVVKDAKTVKVHLSKGSFVSARIISRNPLNDLAVLKVESATTDFLPIAPMRSVKTGDRVFTMGFPVSSLLGEEAKYTEGVISSLSGIENAASLFQITVPVQPGNSGGALLNEKGEVVGVITSTAGILSFIKESGTLPQNVNWAVKADYLRPMIELPTIYKKPLSREQAIAAAKKATFLIETDSQPKSQKESYKGSSKPKEETQFIGVCAKCGRNIRKDEKISMLGSDLLCQECFKKASAKR